MGSRGRSIRLRIYFLVAIPLITMLGLFGYVAYSSVTNWLNLDRAPTLIKETSEPLTNFVNVLQSERRAAVVYLAQPTASNLASFQSAVATTKTGAQTLSVKLHSAATKDSSTPEETTAIAKMTSQIDNMGALRDSVTAKKIAPLEALAGYTTVIAGQGEVLQAEASSITDAAPVLQGLALISAVNTQEDVSEQDAVLGGALAAGSLTGPDRVAFSNAVGRQQQDTLTYQQLFTPAELQTYQATVNKLAPAAVQTQLGTIQQAVPAGTPLSQLGLSPASWQTITHTWLTASSTAGTTTATTVLEANAKPAIDAKRRVWITAAVGVAGLILTLIVTILLGRSINRRLTALRRSALTLAQEQLPSVVSRLRQGESVDVAAEAPPLRAGKDEIGQVGEAIDAVRQEAIRSAVEESRLRQGVNAMFRNLARRNQSLLQRQLTVLDEMERQATDPDVLEDLFKMDHLTTRMRRHAEGLIILSGSPPGRSWSAPVKLIDVMRGAVAEVEDYARVTVSSQSRAALAGPAVTDVIHLLAELIENATTLSPPFTQVRVNGETVANGFAIEIEDRGLGMAPERLHELNERLSNPPALNPANTEQLGLFVVGQLARRHGIRVILRPSPYGGTTVIALLPATLIVAEGPAAITSGGQAPADSAADGYPGASAGLSQYPGGGAVPSGYPSGTAAPGDYPAANGGPAGYPAGPVAASGYSNGISAPDGYGNGNAAPSGYPGGVPAAGGYPERAALPSSSANGSAVNGYRGRPAGAGFAGPAANGPGNAAANGPGNAAADGTGTPAAGGYGGPASAGGSGASDDPADLLAPRTSPNGWPAYDPGTATQTGGDPYAPPAGEPAGYPAGQQAAAEAPSAPAAPAAFGAQARAAESPAAAGPGPAPEWPDPDGLPRRRASGRGNGPQDQGRPAIGAADPFGPPSAAPAAFAGPSGFGGPGTPGPADTPDPAGIPGTTGMPGTPADPYAPAGPRRANTEEVPVVTGVPVSRPTPPPMPTFDVFSRAQRSEPGEAPAQAGQPAPSAYPDFRGPDSGAVPAGPYPGAQPPSGYESGDNNQGGAYQNSAYQNNAFRGSAYQNGEAGPGSNGGYQDQDAYYQDADQNEAGFQNGGAYPGLDYTHQNDLARQEEIGYTGGPGYGGDRAYGNEGTRGNHGDSSGDGTGWESGSGEPAGGDADEHKGLPRRVRQANLAPQLRASATAAGASGAHVPPATAASLTDMRNTLSAMQRGWQQGRSKAQRDMEANADGD